MDKLHPGAKWLFRLSAYGFLFVLGIFVVPFFANLLIAALFISSGGAPSLSWLFVLAPILGLLFMIIFGEVYARMAYARWFYEFTGSNLKIERGIIWKKYTNVPYERVQNVDIQRGILARMLGFSSVMIQTAGMSYSPRGARAEGYIPAVTPKHAEDIREFLMKKISKSHGAGL